MIEIDKIIGKYIYFIDKNQAYRINKVVRVSGNTITTMTATGEKERIHPKANKIFGIVLKAKDRYTIVEEIKFKKEKTGKNIRKKERVREMNREKIKPLTNKRKGKR